MNQSAFAALTDWLHSSWLASSSNAAGDEFAHWYQLRKDSLRAGFLDGKPEHLKDVPAEATLQVSFSPEYDQVYRTTFILTLEHDRQYRIILNGQGTNDEELL